LPHFLFVGGRAIVQAVSRRLPTAAARFRSPVRSCEIFGGKSGIGASFLRVLRFPLPILIPPNLSFSCITRGWYNRSVSGRRTKWTQSHPHPKKLKKKFVFVERWVFFSDKDKDGRNLRSSELSFTPKYVFLSCSELLSLSVT
jgi:hypothetical protein